MKNGVLVTELAKMELYKGVGKVKVTTVREKFSGGTVVERKKPIKAGDGAMTDMTPGP